MFSVSVFQAVGCNLIRETCKDFYGLCLFFFNDRKYQMCCDKRAGSGNFSLVCIYIHSHVYTCIESHVPKILRANHGQSLKFVALLSLHLFLKWIFSHF